MKRINRKKGPLHRGLAIAEALKIFKWPSCKVKCNLQPDECTSASCLEVRKAHIVPCLFDKMYTRGYACRKQSLLATTVHFWSEARSSRQLWHAYLSFYRSFARREIFRNVCQSFIDMSVNGVKGFTFVKSTYIMLFSFIWARDIWLMKNLPDAVQEVRFQLLPSLGSKCSLCDWHFVLKDLIFSHW